MKELEANYINPYHGMELKPGFDTTKRDNENGILFLCEYYLLKKKLGILEDSDVITFDKICWALMTRNSKNMPVPGLYDRGTGESLRKDKESIRTISHDNLTAISCFSALHDLDHHTFIADHLLKSGGRFDNRYPEDQKLKSPKWHPRDWFVWLYLSDKLWHKVIAWLFFPVFVGAALEDCLFTYKTRPVWYKRLLRIDNLHKKPIRKFLDTSGPLLWFVRHETLSRKSIIFKVFYWVCQKLYRRTFGEPFVYEAMTIYFPENHPNNVLARKLKEENEKEN